MRRARRSTFLPGEKVCIQQIRPTQFGAALASRHTCKIDSGVVTTGFEHDADRQPRRGVEPLDDAATVLGHLSQRRFAVEVLAACDEPRFQRFQFHSNDSRDDGSPVGQTILSAL